MIEFNKRNFLLLALALIIATMLFASCSAGESSDNESTNDDESYQIMFENAGVPADGIGRESEEEVEPPVEKSITICIDPGHGFWDGGCGDGYLPDGLLEKDVNLAVAKMLYEELDKLGYQLILTHDGEHFPKSAIDDGNQKFNPKERVSYMNTLNIDYMISIHVNSYESDRSVSGTRIYFKETDKKTSKISGDVAESICEAVRVGITNTRDPIVIDHTKEVSFAVIRDTYAPAALVEIGFATNESDAANMVNPDWQASYAKALASGIDNYFSKLEEGE